MFENICLELSSLSLPHSLTPPSLSLYPSILSFKGVSSTAKGFLPTTSKFKIQILTVKCNFRKGLILTFVRVPGLLYWGPNLVRGCMIEY